MYIFTGYRSRPYMKVIGSRSRSQDTAILAGYLHWWIMQTSLKTYAN